MGPPVRAGFFTPLRPEAKLDDSYALMLQPRHWRFCFGLGDNRQRSFKLVLRCCWQVSNDATLLDKPGITEHRESRRAWHSPDKLVAQPSRHISGRVYVAATIGADELAPNTDQRVELEKERERGRERDYSRDRATTRIHGWLGETA
ncbi:hypothetical protein RRG08_019569 [Elysia crispata]|uniref:Uncharacterized protein n=1 Tax=Elysia crispata TaxID=231223 RepID=A0AAE1D2R1_9GAST|nr:hypothetical protein RRG08_019569 [Elysia crispata]